MRAIPFMSSAPSAVFLLCLLLFSVSQKPFFFFFFKSCRNTVKKQSRSNLCFSTCLKKLKEETLVNPGHVR